MLKLYVGITDSQWYEFLSRGPPRDEVNFWQPSGRTQFRALRPGELFLFKLHSPRNFIVGGGVFGHASLLPVSLAWQVFGESNGAPSLAAMRERVAKYRKEPEDRSRDYQIGCRLLEQPFFWPEELWLPVPASWAPSIQVGKAFDLEEPNGLDLWEAVQDRLAIAAQAVPRPIQEPGVSEAPAPRFGQPRLIEPRLGQGTFRIAVTDAYERRCAVTEEKTLPILDAAHIRSYAEGGVNEINNGLLLRTDVHRLFYLGYVTIDSGHRFVVGRRLKEDFDNGRHYYEMHGQRVRPPRRSDSVPSANQLDWHRNVRFLG